MPVEKVITPEARASYSYLFTPSENKKDDGTIEKKWSIVAIFPKGADLSAMKAAELRPRAIAPDSIRLTVDGSHGTIAAKSASVSPAASRARRTSLPKWWRGLASGVSFRRLDIELAPPFTTVA